MLGRTTMNISLTPELEKLVASKVASGLYPSASEAVFEELEQRDRKRSKRG
jgi:antitoxin ParD1/3/4